jgi:hypothetical protein
MTSSLRLVSYDLLENHHCYEGLWLLVAVL